MRTFGRADGVSVHAIAGGNAVLLAMNVSDEQRRRLLGFALGRRTEDGARIRWMDGFKFFRDLVPDPQPGDMRSTLEHPIQSFLWGHYTATPDTAYDYVVRPLYLPDNGDLAQLRAGVDVPVSVRTEPVDHGRHAIFFNRGAIPSQAFARRFGNRPPADENDPDAEDVKWLSRGLLDGALAFIAQARGPRFSLRAAFYEFSYRPIMAALAAANGSGADVPDRLRGGSRRWSAA